MTDDRMDRAERIRSMREGNRGTDDQTDDAETDAADDEHQSTSTDDASASTEASTSRESESDASAQEAATGETDDAGVSPLTTDSEDASSTAETPAETAAAASRAADAVESQTGVDGGSATDAAVDIATASDGAGDTARANDASDAQAAAQRAAQSAAEVMGTDDGNSAGADAGPATDAPAGDTPTVPTDATGAGTVPGDITGVELPDQQLLEEAMATSAIETTEGGARAAMEGESTQSEEVVRVLEFSLGDEYYCLDIEYVEEIVKRDAVTRVPNTPAFVDGVVDLRGQITTILEPKEMMDIDSEGTQNLIIVFDPEQFEDQGAIGWVVDEVRQVVPVPESEINHPPVDAEYINGVVDRDEYEQFVIWVEPEDALAQATATEGE